MKKTRTHRIISWFLVISLLLNIYLAYMYFFSPATPIEKEIVYLHEEPAILDSTFNNAIETLILNGSDSSYMIIQDWCFDNDGEILPFALISANKWNKNYACLDVYNALLNAYDCGAYSNIEIMDSITRKMAINYLIRAYDISSDTTDVLKNFKDRVHDEILYYYEKGKYITEINGHYLYMEYNREALTTNQDSIVLIEKMNAMNHLERKYLLETGYYR